MKNRLSLGLGNALGDEIEILHSSILGRNSFGRLSDLVVAWTNGNAQLSPKVAGDIRVLIQVLLEFAYPKQKFEPGYFEFSVDQNIAYLSVRFPNQQFENDFVDLEKKLSQYWVASEDPTLLKKVLYANDRVEVRAHQRLNLIEWRICRSIGVSEAAHHDSVFEILVDREDGIQTTHQNYTDLGDLPYQDLLSEVYQSAQEKKGSGDFYFQGSSIQEEDEQVRVHFEREQMNLDDEVNREIKFAANSSNESESRLVFKANATSLTSQEKTIVEGDSRTAVEELNERFGAEKESLKRATETMVRELKAKELQLNKEMIRVELKMEKLEALLKKKELDGIKKGNSIKVLSEKIEEMKNAEKNAAPDPAGFREKAIQMYGQLREVKREKDLLEVALFEAKQRERLNDRSGESKERTIAKVAEVVTPPNVLEDLNKKLERTSRALEAEKAKVKGLFERVVTAEREAQTAVPMIDDLERKAEQSSKLAQQHKKELETVKQKLIKADAEKNKVKNELVKTQAQVQTLLKRQAS